MRPRPPSQIITWYHLSWNFGITSTLHPPCHRLLLCHLTPYTFVESNTRNFFAPSAHFHTFHSLGFIVIFSFQPNFNFHTFSPKKLPHLLRDEISHLKKPSLNILHPPWLPSESPHLSSISRSPSIYTPMAPALISITFLLKTLPVGEFYLKASSSISMAQSVLPLSKLVALTTLPSCKLLLKPLHWCSCIHLSHLILTSTLILNM